MGSMIPNKSGDHFFQDAHLECSWYKTDALAVALSFGSKDLFFLVQVVGKVFLAPVFQPMDEYLADVVP